jgi:hypothetical protein
MSIINIVGHYEQEITLIFEYPYTAWEGVVSVPQS